MVNLCYNFEVKKSVFPKTSENYWYNLIFNCLAKLAPFIFIAYISRVMVPEQVGLYSYYASVIAIVLIISVFGSTSYGKRETSLLCKSKKDLGKFISELISLRLILTIIALLIYYLIASFSEQRLILYLFGLKIIAAGIDITWYFRGVNHFKKATLWLLFAKVLELVLVFIFVRDGSDLLLAVGICSLMSVIGNLLIWKSFLREVKLVKVGVKTLTKHLLPMLLFFLPAIIIQIYYSFDVVLLGNLTGRLDEVANYSQAQSLMRVILLLLVSLGPVIASRIGMAFSRNNLAEVKRLMAKSFQYFD